MKKILTIILVLCSVASFGKMRGGAQYDPGAARKNLSNVDALQLKLGAGTAAAPAYTFSSDPDTGIYSAGADILGFGVGGAEAGRVSANDMTLSGTISADGLKQKTLDGADNASVYCAGGGALGVIRGGYIYAYGNEEVNYGGALWLAAGANVASGSINFYSGGTGDEAARISAGGNVLIATSTDDGANKLQVNGFTKLGEAATGVKMKVLTGTTGVAGAAVNVTHGLTGAKILAFSAKVEYGANNGIPPEFTSFADYNYSVYHDDTNFYVANKTGSSVGVAEKPFKILIWYME